MLHTTESNILEAIFDPKGPNCRIANLIREQYKRGLTSGFTGTLCSRLEKAIEKEITPKLIDTANKEARERLIELTEPFFLIGQALQKQIFEGRRVEHIMIVNGAFTNVDGNRMHELVVPASFGGNPYELFKGLGNKLLDDVITNYKIREYLQKNQEKLLSQDYTKFVIDSSLFFYIPQSELTGNFLDTYGEVDMHRLLPFITNIPHNGSIMTRPPMRPDKQTFLEYCPDFFSARLKYSPLKKLMRKFSEEKLISEDTLIHDIVAYRVVFDDLGKAYEFQEALKVNSYIGSNREFKIVKSHTKDYFKKPKDDFEGLINNLIVEDKKGEEYPVEVQGQIKPNIHHYETKCDPKSPTTRDRKQKRGSRRVGEVLSPGQIALDKFVEGKLKDVYGSPIEIDIKTLETIPHYQNTH